MSLKPFELEKTALHFHKCSHLSSSGTPWNQIQFAYLHSLDLIDVSRLAFIYPVLQNEDLFWFFFAIYLPKRYLQLWTLRMKISKPILKYWRATLIEIVAKMVPKCFCGFRKKAKWPLVERRYFSYIMVWYLGDKVISHKSCHKSSTTYCEI